MNSGFQFLPDQASTIAPRIDRLYLFLWGLSAFFTLLIFLLVVFMGLKYRRRHPDERPGPTLESLRLELFYTIVPLVVVLFIFVWASKVYFDIYSESPAALDVHVVGKQWMWKLQHPQGRREINELHVPVGRRVQLTLASQDVIHSFFIPAFRVKQDVVPGRYTQMSFTPTKVGSYHLFCTEYCGTQHSGMIGRVVVMEPADYEAWLTGVPPEEAPVVGGARLFKDLGCATCHGVQAPSLAGLYGRKDVRVADRTGGFDAVTVNEQYLRESILDSTAKLALHEDGVPYAPIMPSYRGQVTEEQLLQLVAYIKSLRHAVPGSPTTAPADTPPDEDPSGDGTPGRTPSHPGTGLRREND